VQRILRFLRSPIGSKIMMALTGLFLAIFLVAHLGANLLVFKSAEEFNTYSDSLVSSWLIYPAEIGLIFLFGYHAINGVVLAIKNRQARPTGYGHKRNTGDERSRKSLASTLMPVTGVLIFVFLIIHVATMKFGTYYATSVDGEPMRDLFRLVIEKFTDPLWAGGYILAMLVLGLHLWHGLATFFMTLGIRQRSFLTRAGQGLAVILVGGFLLIPTLIFLGGEPDSGAPIQQSTGGAEVQDDAAVAPSQGTPSAAPQQGDVMRPSVGEPSKPQPPTGNPTR